MAARELQTSHWETTLLCNDISHWLGANLESALSIVWKAWLILYGHNILRTAPSSPCSSVFLGLPSLMQCTRCSWLLETYDQRLQTYASMNWQSGTAGRSSGHESCPFWAPQHLLEVKMIQYDYWHIFSAWNLVITSFNKKNMTK